MILHGMGFSSCSVMNQKKIFGHVWETFGESEKGVVFKGFPPMSAFYLGVSIPLPNFIVSRIMESVSRIRESFPDQYFIHPSRYHVTLCGLKTVEKGYDRGILEDYERKLEAICEKTSPFTLEIKNFNVFPVCSFVEVYSKKGRLQELHRNIHTELSSMEKLDFVPHVSAIFFKTCPNDLVREIKTRFRQVEFGEFVADSVEFSEWDLHPRSGLSKPGRTRIFKLRK